MIAIRIHPHRFDHFHRRLRAMSLPLRAGTPYQTIRPVFLHIQPLPVPLHNRGPLAPIPGMPITTPPNQQLGTATSTPKLQFKPLPDFVQPEFYDAAKTTFRPPPRQDPLSIGHFNRVHRVAKTHNSIADTESSMEIQAGFDWCLGYRPAVPARRADGLRCRCTDQLGVRYSPEELHVFSSDRAGTAALTLSGGATGTACVRISVPFAGIGLPRGFGPKRPSRRPRLPTFALFGGAYLHLAREVRSAGPTQSSPNSTSVRSVGTIPEGVLGKDSSRPDRTAEWSQASGRYIMLEPHVNRTTI